MYSLKRRREQDTIRSLDLSLQPGRPRVKRSQPMPHLPEEVWAKIASHMHILDWARACGACRAMYYLKPEVISSQPRDMAEFSWVALRWHLARRIHLDLGPFSRRIAACKQEADSEDAQELYGTLAIVAEHAAPYKNLSQLSMDLGELSSGAVSRLLPLLTQSPKLWLLQMHCPKPILLPTLQHVTLLYFGSCQLPDSHTAPFARLPKLRTLVLRINEYGKDSSGLDLQQCRELKSLILQVMVPKKLAVPDGCSVCVEAHPSVCTKTWEMLSASCNACHMLDSRKRAGNRLLPVLFATHCTSLTFLSIEVKHHDRDLGVKKKPLTFSGEALPNLRHLRICSVGNVCARFAEEVQFETLILCGKRVYVFIAKLRALAESLKKAKFSWMAPPKDGIVTGLVQLMESMGKPCEIYLTVGKWSVSYGMKGGCTCGVCGSCMGWKSIDLWKRS